MKKLLIILNLAFATGLFSTAYIDKEYKFFLDYPEGWQFERTNNPENLISVANWDNSILFHLNIYKEQSRSLAEFYNRITSEIGAKGDHVFFNYKNREAILSNLTLQIEGEIYRGYFIFIKDKTKYFLLYAYSSVENYAVSHDFILSILDSFALEIDKDIFTGPVSAFYYIKRKSNIENVEIGILGKKINLEKDSKEMESSKELIEREARVLLKYTSITDEIFSPWERFYKTIFRDNYIRLKPAISKISEALELDKMTKEEKIKKTALWVQSLKYERSGTISDITPPLEVLFSGKGDCDSRALLYLAFMHYLEIDAVMLVSPEYNHSAIGVDLERNGAKIAFNGKKYLFIELTENVEIGLVPQEKSDASKWHAFKLSYIF